MKTDNPVKNKNRKYVSEATIKRLPVYLHYVQRLIEEGVMYISAPKIGSDLGYDPTQVVKDLAVTEIKGKPRVGYNTYELIHTIEEYLGINKTNEAFLFGAGNLGSALLSYQQMQNLGLKIIAAFDVDPDKIQTKKGNINVLHIDKFPQLAEMLNVSIGVLTTPGSVAQEIADLMVKGGIKAIWNLTPAFLRLPENIVVQNTSMYSNVAVLLKKLELSEK